MTTASIPTWTHKPQNHRHGISGVCTSHPNRVGTPVNATHTAFSGSHASLGSELTALRANTRQPIRFLSLLFSFVLAATAFGPACQAAPTFTLPQVSVGSIYPSQPITIFIPSSAQDQEDLCLPLALPFFQGQTEQVVTLKEVSGMGGALAVNALYRTADDGYSVAVLVFPGFFWQEAQNQPFYTAVDITPLLIVAKMPLALWVPENSPYKTLADLLRGIQNSPYGSVYIAGSGSYSAHHVATRMFNRATGVFAQYMPQIDTIGARKKTSDGAAIACWSGALEKSSMPGMRPLAVTAMRRNPALPDTPTFLEVTYDIQLEQHLGLGMLASTPEKIKKDAADFLALTLTNPSFQAILTGKGFTPLSVEYASVPSFLNSLATEFQHLLETFPTDDP